MENLAEVRMWGEQVGALVYDPSSHTSTFEFAPGWLSLGADIAPLHMPLAPVKYQFPGLNYSTYKGLPAVFADALPDDFGNAVIDAWLAREGRAPESFTPVERLLYTGSRGMGALEFFPLLKRSEPNDESLALDSLVSMAQTVLDERAELKPRIDANGANDDAMKAILQVGTSAGGARAKAVITINKERSQIRSGQREAPLGFEHYLLKLDGVEEHKAKTETFGDPQGFGRMEYAYYLMAKDSGITMSDSELLMEGARAHFMTRRFDRDENRKLHYLSLCGMDHADYKKPGSYSYEQLLGVARRLRLPREDAIEIFRRMVFNIVARNHDDHSKNFGFLLGSPSEPWRLSPAFDIAYSYRKESPWVAAHQMSVNGKRDQFEQDDLIVVANLIGNFREVKSIIRQVVDVVTEWPHYAKRAGVFESLQQEVAANLRVGDSYDWCRPR
ncbi:MAG: type II toxin-antitoxin system HipA family toxin [Agarilytica sp.]